MLKRPERRESKSGGDDPLSLAPNSGLIMITENVGAYQKGQYYVMVYNKSVEVTKFQLAARFIVVTECGVIDH